VPTYQYACTACDHAFEQFQGFSEDSLTVCPQCQGRLRKVFNAVGVVFKGSGFYRTDSRSTASSDASTKAEPSKSPAPAASGGESGSSGSAPAASKGASESPAA
jgi:putative FmdB family regulatory protein